MKSRNEDGLGPSREEGKERSDISLSKKRKERREQASRR